jgi:uncharacterized integral membrane protein
MAVGYLVVAILAAAIAVFALQNGDATPVRFAIWTVQGLPLAALILASLGSGIVIVGVPLLIQRWRLRARLRAAERRIAELEAAAATRVEPARPVAPASVDPLPRPASPPAPRALP